MLPTGEEQPVGVPYEQLDDLVADVVAAQRREPGTGAGVAALPDGLRFVQWVVVDDTAEPVEVGVERAKGRHRRALTRLGFAAHRDAELAGQVWMLRGGVPVASLARLVAHTLAALGADGCEFEAFPDDVVPARDTPVEVAPFRSGTDVTDRFFELQEEILTAKQQRQLDRAVAASWASVELLERFVDSVVSGPIGDGSFPIRTIVSVDTLCQLLPPRRDGEGLLRLDAVLAGVPALAPFRGAVAEAQRRAATAEKVFELLLHEPGVVQSSVAKRLGVDGRDVRAIVHWWEADGVVLRRPSGKSAELFLAGTPRI